MSRIYQPPPADQLPTIDSLVAAVDRTVAGLEQEKRRLCATLHRHFLAAYYDRPFRPANVLLLGPSGGGKMVLTKAACDALGVPWVEVACTEFSDVGILGRDLTSMFCGFWGPRWCDPAKGSGDWVTAARDVAQRFGIVVLDEFDKLRKTEAKTADAGGRVKNQALQNELLKIVEGSEFHAKRSENDKGLEFSSHGVLFIAMGAFDGIENIVAPAAAGPVDLRTVSHGDVMRYGFSEELTGRFGALLALSPLRVEDLLRILEEQVWPVYVQQAADAGLELIADHVALAHIAQTAVNAMMGARALSVIVETTLGRAWADARPGDALVVDAEALARHHARIVRREAA